MTEIQVLLDAIGTAEGARPGYWNGNPYDLTLGRLNLVTPVSQQTIAQVKDTQKWMTTELRMMSGAVGKYQVINKTLREMQKKIGFSDNDIFDADLQDSIAVKLLERRGLRKFLAGVITVNEFMKNLSKEWASLPNPDTGHSYYGQRTHYSVPEMKQLLESLI